jgi:hypothetical protein
VRIQDSLHLHSGISSNLKIQTRAYMLTINASNPIKIAKSITDDLFDAGIGFTGLPIPPGPPGVPGIDDKFFNVFVNDFDFDCGLLDLRGILIIYFYSTYYKIFLLQTRVYKCMYVIIYINARNRKPRFYMRD